MTAVLTAELTHPDSLQLTRIGLGAVQLASTAGQVRAAVESMLALPGMSWPKLSRSESLLIAVKEQRELARLHDIDAETGLANRRRFCRALLEMNAHPNGALERGHVIIVRLAPASSLRSLMRSGYVCTTALREVDLAARLGHRRLGVLVRESSHGAALAVAARLRAGLVALQRPSSEAEPSVLVVSRQRRGSVASLGQG